MSEIEKFQRGGILIPLTEMKEQKILIEYFCAINLNIRLYQFQIQYNFFLIFSLNFLVLLVTTFDEK